MTAIPDDVTMPMPTNYETWDRENIRRHVATAAMNGLLAAHAGDGVSLPTPAYAATKATEYADALLAELAK